MRGALVLLLSLLAPLGAQEAASTEAAAADSEVLPLAVPVDPVEELRSAEEVLAEATGLLVEGRFKEALDVAIPAISTYPGKAESFQAVAQLAVDQLHRQASRPAAAAPAPYSTPGPADVGLIPTRAPRSRFKGIRTGFDVGTLNMARLDLWYGGSVVDSWGFRVGGGVVPSTAGLFRMGVGQGYVDWHITDSFDIENHIGLAFYAGSPYPLTGGLFQYDPDAPFHVQGGVNLGAGGLSVEAGVGFLW